MNYITATDIKDYFYCDRLLYFKEILSLREKPTIKMTEGSQKHETWQKRFQKYTWINLKPDKKLFRQTLIDSEKEITGVPDCILFLGDEIIPLEFKSFPAKKISPSTRCQMIFYGLLIEHNYHTLVQKAALWHEQDNHIMFITITRADKEKVNEAISDVKNMLENEIMPLGTMNI